MGRDLVAGAAAIVIGGGYLLMAVQIRASALADSVGPGGFPKVLAVFMIGLGLVLCVQALLAGRRDRANAPAATAFPPTAADPDPEPESERGGIDGLLRAAGMLAIGIVYLLIVRTVGYVPAIAALIVAATLYGGARLSWRVFAIGVAGALLYWLVFVWLLGIPLPGGVLADIL